jgi:FemAB-related protein (PEP-CTERM system-associated)
MPVEREFSASGTAFRSPNSKSPAPQDEINVRRAERSDLTKWQDFVDRMPEAGCMHHAAWYDILRDAFWVEPHFLLATDKHSDVQGVLALYQSDSLITGRHMSSLEEGVLATHPKVARALIGAALRLRDRVGAKYLQIRGPSTDELDAKIIRTVHTVIATSKPEEALWAAVKKKTRWAIRQSLKLPISVQHDPGLKELESFYLVYAEHMRALGTPVVGFDMFDSIRSRLGINRLRLYIVRHKARVIGGMLCIINCGRWTDQYAIVRPSEDAEFANYLLYWHAIRDAASHKIPLFDLGRCTPGSNVHLFKRKWGGNDVDVPYHFYPSKSGSMDDPGLEGLKKRKSLVQRAWSRLPLAVCNRLGPLLRKRLPFI